MPVNAEVIAFRDEVLGRGLLVGTDVPGVYGRSGEFEDTLVRLDRLVGAAGAADDATLLRFPPVVSRGVFERSGYLQSFPHLAGTINAFAGDDAAHRELMRVVENGSDWSAAFTSARLVLTPAACYPVYPALTGRLPPGGRLIDVSSYCFRHEPSDDPARMQMFRMREHVRAGEPEAVVAWRETWLGRVADLAAALGLEARTDLASDPFFGRGGKLLALNQRERRLKIEVLATIASHDQPTAIMSLNYHEDHFGSAFGIVTSDGQVAHTACVGFGLERMTLAMYRRHGFERQGWPSRVRELLEL
jgi:seryl-tRNA synthetase